MLLVRKDVRLVGQVGASGIDQINTRQPYRICWSQTPIAIPPNGLTLTVLPSNRLGAKVLLDRDRIVSASFDPASLSAP